MNFEKVHCAIVACDSGNDFYLLIVKLPLFNWVQSFTLFTDKRDVFWCQLLNRTKFILGNSEL